MVLILAGAAFLPGILPQTKSSMPTVPAGTIRIVESAGEVLYMESGRLPAKLQSNASLPIHAGGALQTLEGTLQFILPDSSRIYLDRFSKVALTQIADPLSEERNNVLTLTQGRLLIVYSPPSGFSSLITAPTDLRAQVLGSILGAAFDPAQSRLEVDCLEGACLVANARDILHLNGGEYSWANSGGIAPPGNARYDLWAGIGGMDAAWITPTSIPAATSTPTATATRKFTLDKTAEAPPSGSNPTATPELSPTVQPTVEPPTDIPTEAIPPAETAASGS